MFTRKDVEELYDALLDDEQIAGTDDLLEYIVSRRYYDSFWEEPEKEPKDNADVKYMVKASGKRDYLNAFQRAYRLMDDESLDMLCGSRRNPTELVLTKYIASRSVLAMDSFGQMVGWVMSYKCGPSDLEITQPCDMDCRHVAMITEIYVDPDRRREGIAQAMLHRYLSHYVGPHYATVLTVNEAVQELLESMYFECIDGTDGQNIFMDYRHGRDTLPKKRGR